MSSIIFIIWKCSATMMQWRNPCLHRVSAVVHCGRRWEKDGGVLLPGPAEEHPPLHFQEPWPPRPLWSSVAQAEHFCAEQHSVHLHGLQALGEKADRREGRHWPHRAHTHHHTGGGWTTCGRTCRATKTILAFAKATYQKLQSFVWFILISFFAQVRVQHVFDKPQNVFENGLEGHIFACVFCIIMHSLPASNVNKVMSALHFSLIGDERLFCSDFSFCRYGAFLFGKM